MKMMITKEMKKRMEMKMIVKMIQMIQIQFIKNIYQKQVKKDRNAFRVVKN